MSLSPPPHHQRPLTLVAVIGLATLAIIAFAGNSLLARAALADGAIEPGAYSLIRLASGALVLLPFVQRAPRLADMPGALALFTYVAFFSWAYVALPAAAGALVLFASVQATVMGLGFVQGERPGWMGLAGMALAMGGLAVLLLPGASAATPYLPAILMAVAGVAWGAFTMLGRKAEVASIFTARSFVLGAVFAVPLLLLDASVPSTAGVVLAVASGAITSGAGYVVWNRVSPSLGLATVATVQLATPPAAALGGVFFLDEGVTATLILAGAMIVGGILLTLKRR
ncbi:DMT family transporter [Erythrobacteraceae bacterium E2-1 Yellow Sea]|nr:DMT family transporter [Erythrobacteraceae bacterium E2-1 Yellow Sea]